jgi:hypothetical protein
MFTQEKSPPMACVPSFGLLDLYEMKEERETRESFVADYPGALVLSDSYPSPENPKTKDTALYIPVCAGRLSYNPRIWQVYAGCMILVRLYAE